MTQIGRAEGERRAGGGHVQRAASARRNTIISVYLFEASDKPRLFPWTVKTRNKARRWTARAIERAPGKTDSRKRYNATTSLSVEGNTHAQTCLPMYAACCNRVNAALVGIKGTHQTQRLTTTPAKKKKAWWLPNNSQQTRKRSSSNKKHTPQENRQQQTHLEHLEERRLSGVAAGGAGGHHNVDGCEGAHTGRGGHAVGLDDVADIAELTVGEDEAHVAHDAGEDLRHRGGRGAGGGAKRKVGAARVRQVGGNRRSGERKSFSRAREQRNSNRNVDWPGESVVTSCTTVLHVRRQPPGATT